MSSWAAEPGGARGSPGAPVWLPPGNELAARRPTGLETSLPLAGGRVNLHGPGEQGVLALLQAATYLGASEWPSKGSRGPPPLPSPTSRGTVTPRSQPAQQPSSSKLSSPEPASQPAGSAGEHWELDLGATGVFTLRAPGG